MPEIKVVEGAMSTNYDKRYVVIDADTGNILDDAQGYGYKTAQKAHLAYAYKTRDKSKDAAKRKLVKEIMDWQQPLGLFHLMDQIAFDIAKGSYGPDAVFNTKTVKEILQVHFPSLQDCPYAAKDVLYAWEKGETILKNQRKRK